MAIERGGKKMRILGNILWFVLGGFIMAILCYLAGAILCLTIVGIPFGLQLFKVGNLCMWPFGNDIKTNFDAHPIANVLWLIFCGWELCLNCLAVGAVMCITIVGIPFGLQWFKLAVLCLIPFGAEITNA